ncbi:transcriptional repressor LexA [Sphingomonas sp. 22L2VL55-3]
MLTRKQHELVCFINDRLNDTGVSPSFEEMKDALDLKSKSGVHRLDQRARGAQLHSPPAKPRARARSAAHARACREKSPSKASNVKTAPAAATPQPANDVVEIPLHGRIAAGVPIEAFEGSTMLAVPAALLGTGEHYALEVSGDSMVEAGILDGDYALIRRTETARDGEIVVALIEDSEATLKYFRREGAMVRLDPANRAYDPQRYAPPKSASKANSPASFAATTERPRPTCVINALAGLGFSCLGNVPAQAGKPSRSLPLATATGLIGKLSDVLGAVWDSSSICPSKERQASGRLCPASMHKRDLDSNPQYLCLRASARTYRRLSPRCRRIGSRGDAETRRCCVRGGVKLFQCLR